MRTRARFIVEGQEAGEIARRLQGIAEVVQIDTHPRARWQAIDVEAADLGRVRALERELAARLGAVRRLGTQYVP